MIHAVVALCLWAHCLQSVGSIKTHAVSSSSSTSQVAFDQFRERFNRSYQRGSAEYDMRWELFQQRLAAVMRQNSRPSAERLWTAALNDFSDYTPKEMNALTGYRRGWSSSGSSSSLMEADATDLDNSAREDTEVRALTNVTLATLPEDVSWVSLWMAQPENVHRQECGNCWATSTASMFEAHVELYFGLKRHFNFNEITKCTDNPHNCGGTGGCSGAIPELALFHLQANWFKSDGDENSGTECPETRPSAMPEILSHKPHEPQVGNFDTPQDSPARHFGFVGWERLPQNKIEPIKRALVARGPLTVALSTDWSGYHAGIFDDCDPNAKVSHSVVLLGYGKDTTIRRDRGGTKYWLIQNSWGPLWAEAGKARLLRLDDKEEEDFCGVDDKPELGNGCTEGPTQVTVCGACGMLFDTTVVHLEPRQPDIRDRLARYLGIRA